MSRRVLATGHAGEWLLWRRRALAYLRYFWRFVQSPVHHPTNSFPTRLLETRLLAALLLADWCSMVSIRCPCRRFAFEIGWGISGGSKTVIDSGLCIEQCWEQALPRDCRDGASWMTVSRRAVAALRAMLADVYTRV